jgi:uncharacterized membrane protein
LPRSRLGACQNAARRAARRNTGEFVPLAGGVTESQVRRGMEARLSRWVDYGATGIELLATALIVSFIALGCLKFLYASLMRKGSALTEYQLFRERLGRAMLLGLEILVAADVVRTVASGATLDTIVPLGLLVLVRTFLTWSLVVEIEGRWPWQPSRGHHPDQQPEADRAK